MAFNDKKSSVSKIGNSANGFANVDVIMSDGSTQRIGGIALHSNKRLHERLLERGSLDGLNLQITLNVIDSDAGDLDFATGSIDEQLVEEMKQAQ